MYILLVLCFRCSYSPCLVWFWCNQRWWSQF